ncbi:MAG: NAD-dependent epimerase/dehydratase family protein, partial [Bacteroidales bacterium]|nr:NAD-dependent epimerase/dehydratase family protein [Bacteroidales bacterium]
MNSDPIYLVTGAAGHLGYTIVMQLVNDGHKVRALVLPQDTLGSRLPREVQIVRGDVLDKRSLDIFFTVPPGVDTYLIHSAGIVTTSLKYRQIVYDVNVQGTKNILEAAMKHEVKKMVYVSSVHAIPE